MHSAYTSKVAISGIASLELGVADGDWMLVTGWDNGLSLVRVQGERCVGTCLAGLADLGEGCKRVKDVLWNLRILLLVAFKL